MSEYMRNLYASDPARAEAREQLLHTGHEDIVILLDAIQNEKDHLKICRMISGAD